MTDRSADGVTGNDGDEHAALVRDLLRPAAYPHRPLCVQRIETHFSNLFLAGERVYKLKKPVKLPFADFSDRGKRRRFTFLELERNRPLTRGVYLGVEEVRFDPENGYSIDGPGELVEYALEMRRLPADRSLEALVRGGRLGLRQIRAISRRIAEFHRGAKTVPPASRLGGYRSVLSSALENLEEIEDYAGPLLGTRLMADLTGYTRSFLSSHRGLFEQRLQAGCIRECHGDLHAGNIFLEESGCIQIIDAIEFNEMLSSIDPAADIAFLTMDLKRLGEQLLADACAAEYLRETGDDGAERLLGFYEVYRALVRCKIAALQSSLDSQSERKTERIGETTIYSDLAARMAARQRPPMLVITAGTAGSGKTTAAAALADRWGMAHLSTDLIRKRLAGLDPLARTGSEVYGGIYAPEMSDRTYGEMARQAELSLKAGHSVVLDGTYLTRARRAAAVEVGRRHGASPVLAVCSLERDEQIRRLQIRRSSTSSVSEGGPEVMAANEEHWEPVDPAEADSLFRLDTGGSHREVERDLFQRAWEAVWDLAGSQG